MPEKKSDMNEPENERISWSGFSDELRRLWDKEASLSKSLELVHEYPEFREKSGRTGRRQRLRVLGGDKLLNGGVRISERAEGPVYSPVPNRVMYSVYSTPAFNSNGYSTRSRGVAKGLKAAGADVVVVARAGYPWDWKTDVEKPEQRRHVTAVDEIPYVHLPNGDMASLSPDAYIEQAAEAFVREALIQRPSVIQAASSYRVAMPALIAARRLGIPFIYEVRGLWELTGASNSAVFANSERFFAMKDFESRVAREADAVLAITRQVADELVERGVNPDRITLAPNAVDPGDFQPQVADGGYAASKGLRSGVPTVGFAGSIVKYEGLNTLLEASQLLHDRGVLHQVVIAGSGNAEEILRTMAQKREMSWVHFLGRLPQEEIPTLLSTFDIVATPRTSSVVTEMVSALKPLEAFAAGRAAVLSDVAPNIDLAGVEQERAVLFQAGNAEHLADVLQNLVSSPERRIRIASAAREWIEKERTWAAIGNKMLGAHRDAKENFQKNIVPFGSLSDISVGVIVTEATRHEMENTLQVHPLSPSYGIEQLDSLGIDFVFAELAEDAGGGMWTGGMTSVEPEDHAAVEQLLEAAKCLGIQTVLWMPRPQGISEQLPAFVEMFDHVLTADYSVSQSFFESDVAETTKLAALPRFFDPKLYNPLKSKKTLSMMNAAVLTTSPRQNWRRELVDDKTLLNVLNTYNPTTIARVSESWFRKTQLDFKEPAGASQDSWLRSDSLWSDFYVAVNMEPESAPVSLESLTSAASGIPVLAHPRKPADDWLPETFIAGLEAIKFAVLTEYWQKNEEAYIREIWHQLRNVHRSHTAQTQLALLARSLGLPVATGARSSYGLRLESLDSEDVDAILAQSVLPVAVAVDDFQAKSAVAQPLESAGVSVVPSQDGVAVEYWGYGNVGTSCTYYEDLLIAAQSGEWAFVQPAKCLIDSRIFTTSSIPAGNRLERSRRHEAKAIDEIGLEIRMASHDDISDRKLAAKHSLEGSRPANYLDSLIESFLRRNAEEVVPDLWREIKNLEVKLEG